ncbi:MAG: TetR/AcrR family transcriptional regulator [Pseudomonadales bacterium]
MNDKSTYHHGDLRSALLDAAESILEQHGLHGFTLRKCAKAAGVSHAAPQHHFGNVTGLLTAIAARGFARLLTTLRRHLRDAGTDLSKQFVATSDAYTEFAESHQEHFRIMFRCDLLDMGNEELNAAATNTFLELTNVIRRQRGEADLQALSEIPSTDTALLLSDILIGWCFVHGYAHLRIEQQLAPILQTQQQAVRTTTATRLSMLMQKSESH